MLSSWCTRALTSFWRGQNLKLWNRWRCNIYIVTYAYLGKGGKFQLPYARHYKPWLVFFLPIFHCGCGLYCRAAIISWFFFLSGIASIYCWQLDHVIYLVLRKKELLANLCKFNKMTTIFTQNDNLRPFWVKIIVILWICSAWQTIISFSAWDKSFDPTAKS